MAAAADVFLILKCLTKVGAYALRSQHQVHRAEASFSVPVRTAAAINLIGIERWIVCAHDLLYTYVIYLKRLVSHGILRLKKLSVDIISYDLAKSIIRE
ncbi:hypothetical protein H6B51_17170 [Pseudoflavonifractor phocaeensis]|nr:hypothetical protein [Pseudoflavonifractor phocaeensis]